MKTIRKYRALIIGIIIFILFLVIVFVAFSKPQSQQWNVVTLKEYMDQRFASMQLAVATANAALEKRLDNTNEWRGSQDDLINSMKRDYTPLSEFLTLKEQVAKAEKKQDAAVSQKQGGSVVWAYVIAGLSLIIALFKDKLIKR